MWSLLAVTPAVQLSRIDVGGNRAGTQTGYTAYGLNGQVRVLIEGINTTEGTAASGFYFDYASLEEAFLGTAGQSAEMPTPGVQSQFIPARGGNTFQGEYLPRLVQQLAAGLEPSDEVIALRHPRRSNEMQGYRDTAHQRRRARSKKDKVWCTAPIASRRTRSRSRTSASTRPSTRSSWNPSTKWTYQMNQNNKFIGYYQCGLKLQPNRLPFATYFYDNEGRRGSSRTSQLGLQGRVERHHQRQALRRSALRRLRLLLPAVVERRRDTSAGATPSLGEIEGSYHTWQIDRDRKQTTGAATYFLDTGKGSHTFKFGGELLQETAWEGYLAQAGQDPSAPFGMIDHQYTNGASTSVVFRIPTAINHSAA